MVGPVAVGTHGCAACSRRKVLRRKGLHRKIESFGAPRRGFAERAFDAQAFGGRRFGQSAGNIAGNMAWRGGAAVSRLPGAREDTYVAASPQLAASPIYRGHRAAIPRREALILLTAINYPWLLHEHLEELAAAEFLNADTQKLKGALIDVFAHHFADDFTKEPGEDGDAERTALAAELARRGFADCSSGSSAPSPPARCGVRVRKPQRPMFY